MIELKEMMKYPEFWMEKVQNEIYYNLKRYQEEKSLNQTQLAQHLGFSKGYISQILKGEFNHSIKKLIELGLAINKILEVKFISFDEYLVQMYANSEINMETGKFSNLINQA